MPRFLRPIGMMSKTAINQNGHSVSKQYVIEQLQARYNVSGLM